MIVQRFVVAVEGVENPGRRGRRLLRHELAAGVVWKEGVEKMAALGDRRVRRGREGGFSTAQRKCSANVVSVASSAGLVRRSSVMVSTEYMTVEWCFAKSLPISG